MAGNIFDWSTTALNNDSADGDINWKEGQNAKTVNNSARQMMGRLAEFLLDLGGQGTVGGTANAITLTLNSAFTGLKSGLVCSLKPTADNTAAVTLNVNGIGGKAIRKFDTTGEVALASGDLQAGNFYLLVYDLNANSSAGAWIVLNPTPAVYQASSSKLTDIAALAVTDGNIIVGNGTTWTAESGATARASLGLGSAATTDSTAYATAAQGTKADGAAQKTDLASTASGKGASTIGVQDSGGFYASGTVEGVLGEIGPSLLDGSGGYKNVAGSRASGTSYRNTGKTPIEVYVTAFRSANLVSAKIEVSANNSTWITICNDRNGGDTENTVSVNGRILPAYYYRVTMTADTFTWVEVG